MIKITRIRNKINGEDTVDFDVSGRDMPFPLKFSLRGKLKRD